MRGAHIRSWRFTTRGRIIPADAGSTWPFAVAWQYTRDHPRGCGEHFEESSMAKLTVGSSPRMRGALFQCVTHPVLGRIIPADAGSTFWRQYYPRQFEDHPRGCGEHPVLVSTICTLSGSSPRMRGALAVADLSSVLRWDHPRGCGEHGRLSPAPSGRLGSSPRMRGAQFSDGGIRVVVGIIPADAGSTFCLSSTGPRSADHPRGCGEHRVLCGTSCIRPGSSPRMRGALIIESPIYYSSGIIPADAGSTPIW